jgi:hypothetical protein
MQSSLVDGMYDDDEYDGYESFLKENREYNDFQERMDMIDMLDVNMENLHNLIVNNNNITHEQIYEYFEWFSQFDEEILRESIRRTRIYFIQDILIRYEHLDINMIEYILFRFKNLINSSFSNSVLLNRNVTPELMSQVIQIDLDNYRTFDVINDIIRILGRTDDPDNILISFASVLGNNLELMEEYPERLYCILYYAMGNRNFVPTIQVLDFIQKNIPNIMYNDHCSDFGGNLLNTYIRNYNIRINEDIINYFHQNGMRISIELILELINYLPDEIMDILTILKRYMNDEEIDNLINDVNNLDINQELKEDITMVLITLESKSKNPFKTSYRRGN